MLPSQLCMCDKTESKPKLVSNLNSVVTMSKNINLWYLEPRLRSVMLFLNLMMMYAKRTYCAISQGIRTIKTFIEQKKCCC